MDATARPPYAAITLVSACALGYEVLLTRLFSIVLWHHFAYLILSAALLGYGAGGALLTLARERSLARFGPLFVACCALFGLAMPLAFLAAQRVPFNPLELLWDPEQPRHLLAIYLALFLPFLFAGGAIALAFARFGAVAHHVYAADIAGAGAGCAALVLALFALEPLDALRTLGALGVIAAAFAWRALRLRPGAGFELLLAASLWPLAFPASFWTLQPSPYKDLSQALRVTGARAVLERSGPLAQITVVESDRIPFRHAPGLSLASPIVPPRQLGVFTDGNGFAPITRFDGRPESVAYLDYLTSALPYHLVARPRVLVLGAGAGGDVLQALALGAATVDAVELNPDVVGLVTGPYADFAGRIYARPEVRLHLTEARAFSRASVEHFDIVHVALLDAFGASSAGLQALSESPLYTVEALGDFLDRLAPGGFLAITRWVTLPPRDTLKLFATAAVALERSGVREPARRLALVRGWKTATLLVKNGDLEPREIAALRRFCDERAFDLGWIPGMREEEANTHHVLDRPYFFEGAVALAGAGRAEFIERYKFDIAPATDDRPYFFRFFRWSSAREFFELKDRGGLPLLEWGYPVLVATLLQAVAASAVLILLPLALRGPRAEVRRGAVFVHFLAIGLGFMFLEIAFIQKLMLFLAHPLYAVAVALASFLVFAGVGSRIALRLAEPRRLPIAVSGIALLGVVYVFAMPLLVDRLAGLPDAARIAVAVASIAPLALCLGVPFPSSIATLARRDERLVPWAWAVNGCASVVGVVLATLLAVHLGFSAVVLIAVGLYGVAWAVRPT
jgi:hypothetical protein